MSTQAPREFNFWEYVHCAVCHLPFIADPVNAPTVPPSTPFWLTECGHTLCNAHLKPDQSCAACGATTIQLIPLQKEMAPPMADWFRSIPQTLEAIAGAARFQQEMVASRLHYFKRKCGQYRAIAKRVGEVETMNKTLRSHVEELQKRLENLRAEKGVDINQGPQPHACDRAQHRGSNENYLEPSDSLNANGKRTLTSTRIEHYLSSSPRSITTPSGPSRITLPPDHHPPPLPPERGPAIENDVQNVSRRPGSRRLDHYAYQAPTTPIRPMPLRHIQQTHSTRFGQESREQMNQLPVQAQQSRSYAHASGSMPPPPPPMGLQGNPIEFRRNAQGSGHFRAASRFPIPFGQAATPQANSASHSTAGIPVLAQRMQAPSVPSRVPSTEHMISRPQTAPQTRLFAPGMTASGNLNGPRTPLPSASTGSIFSERNTRTPFMPNPRT